MINQNGGNQNSGENRPENIDIKGIEVPTEEDGNC
jgi:hypothetical protein